MALLVTLTPRLPAQVPAVETQFTQVAPVLRPLLSYWQRSPNQDRAVVLLHGLRPHPISDSAVARAVRSGWQEPGSALVQALGREADVFAFAYGQNAPVDAVAAQPELLEGVRRLRELGYLEVVLLGHSAGGVIARRFVEDFPGAGVTKVIQVDSPNGGAALAKATLTVRKSQEVFLASLTPAVRQAELRRRCERVIPDSVEFVCVVGTVFGIPGDGILSRTSQWTDDLQRQGIPAIVLGANHLASIRSAKAAELLAGLVHYPQPRWPPERVLAARQTILKLASELPAVPPPTGQ
jgi:pimeloyl-ACP methyl ester carboxylesterase